MPTGMDQHHRSEAPGFRLAGTSNAIGQELLWVRKKGRVHGKNALATLATRLTELSGNPRDACLRFLHQQGIAEKRAWRPWTKLEQQRLFDLIESCPIQEIFLDYAALSTFHSLHDASPGRKHAERSRLVHG